MAEYASEMIHAAYTSAAGDIKEIEKIQNRATGLVIKLKNKPYTDRLIYLNLPTLKYRFLWSDMIEVFKITHNIYNTTLSPDLSVKELTPQAITMNCRIILSIMIYETFFSARIVNICNRLPKQVLAAPSS